MVTVVTRTEKAKYQIVGEFESNLEGLISISSPIARALIGKTIGDSVELLHQVVVKAKLSKLSMHKVTTVSNR